MNIDKKNMNKIIATGLERLILPLFLEMATVAVTPYRFNSQMVDVEEWINGAAYRAWTKLYLYQPSRGDAFSYFYKIIYNHIRYCVREYLRTKKDTVSIDHCRDILIQHQQSYALYNTISIDIDDIKDLIYGTKYMSRKRIKQYLKEKNIETEIPEGRASKGLLQDGTLEEI